MKKPRVFISSSRPGLDVAREIARQLDATAEVILWPAGAFHAGQTPLESFTEVAERTDFAVFIVAGGDGEAGPRPPWTAYSNTMFELGMFVGRLGLSRTFIVVADGGTTSLPSDLSGLLYIALQRGDPSQNFQAVAPAVSAIRARMTDVRANPRSTREFHSCFISYAWNDKEFASRLHDDLRQVGVSGWLDAHEIRTGDHISDQIHRAIESRDKMLLVLSEASIRSEWVRYEARKALELEGSRRRIVLFPLRLDGSIFGVSGIQELDRIREKHVIDFSDWQDRERYRRAFSSLVRDLAISESVESERPP